jgi:hypothetical protein
MMRSFSSLLACATLTLSAGLLGCTPDVGGDPFASIGTSLTASGGDGDGDPGDTSDTGTTGDGDGDTGDGDGDPGCAPGVFNQPCCEGVCDDGLICDANDICTLGGGDGDGDTGDGDGDPLPACDANDTYCLNNGCPDTMGMGLVLDTDMDGVNDWGWCNHGCIDAMDVMSCPAHPGGGMAACVDYTGTMDFACFLPCDVNDPNSCAVGSECLTLAGPALCMYPADMF